MSETTQLRESVIDQAHLRGRGQLDKAKKEQEEQFKKDLEEMRTELEKQKDVSHSKIKDQYEREIQQLSNRKRQSSLASKQDILQELFQSSIQEMNHWNREEQLKFLYQVLEDFKESTVEIKFGGLTLKQLKNSDLEDLQANFKGIIVNKEPIKQQGGFILTEGRIDYNYIYSKLVEATRLEISSSIAQRIFDEV